MDAYGEIFKDFSSPNEVVIKTGDDEFKIKLDTERVISYMRDFVIYLSQNKEIILNDATEYINELDGVELKKDFGIEKEDILNEVEANKESIYYMIDQAFEMFTQFDKNEEAAAFREDVKGTGLEAKIKKVRNTYTEEAKGQMVYKGVTLATMNVNETFTKTETAVEQKTVEKSVLLETITKDFNEQFNKVETLELNWTSEATDNLLYIYEDRTISPEFLQKEYFIKEGRIYLPLRYVAEAFGEEVEWDQDKLTSKVIVGDKVIEMEGELRGDVSYVKIRDLEKLGYKISYEQEYGWNSASITK